MNVRVAPAEVLPPATVNPAQILVLPVLLAISFSHMLNDLIQSLIPSIYPLLKSNYDLSFTQIGFLTLTFQITASLLQPVVGTPDGPAADAVLPAGRDGLHAHRAADAVPGA